MLDVKIEKERERFNTDDITNNDMIWPILSAAL